MYVHVCTHIYMCVYTRMYMYVHVCTYIYIYLDTIFKRSKHVPSKIATVFIFKSLPHNNYCLALLSALMILDRKQSASYHYFIAGLMSQDKIYYSHMCSVVVYITAFTCTPTCVNSGPKAVAVYTAMVIVNKFN